MTPNDSRATNVRYLVLAVLCSMAFLTYLDRICIMRVQEEMARDLNFGELTEADQQELQNAAGQRFEPLLTKEDKNQLRENGQQEDLEARRDLAEKRLREDRVKERMSWVFSAFIWGYALFEVPGGWLGDVWGSRLVILRIVLWWSLFTALTGSVDIMAYWFAAYPETWLFVLLMVLVRFLFGLGEAGAYPNINRVLARWFPFEHRATAIGTIWLASRLGGAASPLIIGGLMALTGGWRQAFWILGVAGAVWAAFFYLWFRNRPEEKLSVNAAERELIRAHSTGPGSIYDDTHHAGVPWKRVLFSTNLWAVYITAAAVSFSWYFYITFLPKYLKERFGTGFADSEFMSGLPLLVGGVFCLAGGRLSDWLIRRTGSRRWGRSLPGLIGFSSAGLCALAIPHMNSAWGVIAIICLACALQDPVVPCVSAVCADIGQRYTGTVFGCANSVGAVGAALSPLVAAKVSSAYGWETVFIIFAIAYILGGLLWLRIDATKSIMSEPGRPHSS